MAVTSDGKILVVNSRLNSAVYSYSLPDLKLLGSVDVGRAPDWVTLTPDGKTAYVANAQSNSVSVVDIQIDERDHSYSRRPGTEAKYHCRASVAQSGDGSVLIQFFKPIQDGVDFLTGKDRC